VTKYTQKYHFDTFYDSKIDRHSVTKKPNLVTEKDNHPKLDNNVQ